MYNCNNHYEKIKKILEKQNKNAIYRYIQSPRGKKEEPGQQGSKGDKGDISPQGEAGSVISSSNQGIFYTNLLDTEDANSMTFENP